MEPICIVRSTQTPTMDRELYWACIFNNKKSLAKMIVSYAIILLFAIYLGFESYPNTFRYWRYLETDTRILMLLSMVLFATSLIRMIFRARIYANKREKARRKILGNEPSCAEYLFYGDRFLFRSNTSSRESWIIYAGVKKLKETRHLYILITEETLYCFSKEGFVKGSWEQLAQLLQEKGNIA